MAVRKTVEELAARQLIDNLGPLAKRIKDAAGSPYNVAPLTPEQELWAWKYRDDTVDVDMLRQQGLSDMDAAHQAFPMRKRMIEQAGPSFKERQQYAQRVAARAEKADLDGRELKRPERPE